MMVSIYIPLYEKSTMEITHLEAIEMSSKRQLWEYNFSSMYRGFSQERKTWRSQHAARVSK